MTHINSSFSLDLYFISSILINNTEEDIIQRKDEASGSEMFYDTLLVALL